MKHGETRKLAPLMRRDQPQAEAAVAVTDCGERCRIETTAQERAADARDWPALKERIREWASALGFQHTGVTGVDLSVAEARLLDWLGRGFQGDMDYLVAAWHAAQPAPPSWCRAPCR